MAAGVPDLGMKDGVSGEWWIEWRTEWRLVGRLGELRWLFGDSVRMLANGFGPRPRPFGCGIREPLTATLGVAGVDRDGDRGLAKLAASPAPNVGDVMEPPA